MWDYRYRPNKGKPIEEIKVIKVWVEILDEDGLRIPSENTKYKIIKTLNELGEELVKLK